MGRKPSKRVILTRSREDIERDRALFEKLGFEVIELPLIKTEPLDYEVREEDISYIVFQSTKAVKYFLRRSGIPEDAKVVAVGEKTKKELESLGCKVWLVPEDMSAEGILKEFPEGKGEKVLIPRSEQGRDELIEGLSKKGYKVLPLNVYRTVRLIHPKETLMNLLKGGGFIIFASPSAVQGFFENLQESTALALLNNLIVVSIGKTTKKELEKFGIIPNIIPEKPLMEEVAGKIHRFWQENCIG
ncbi:uroporphyrinogen-III synthase [Hydrogenivirga caldilitoris]|uniref:Uroporphyrinogen-III synthase n=1 Tax=Hydrogenivirga caldilitoris TaxID=246264 RepID=A0A497XSR1_9AQUI|nr:uroporphyrinogen-III synthase [Hydrogenivirga caldilitoris]RLJ71139.1 uroporphyrinogen-III synthase [Hydrogenivirga caldilitoris]